MHPNTARLPDSIKTEHSINTEYSIDKEHSINLDSLDEEPLTWESTYAIALSLRRQHPGVKLEQVSLGMIYRWTIALPEFNDDRELANEAILAAIYQEWFEEEFPL